MYMCGICEREFKSLNALGLHIYYSHKDITLKQYYDKFLKKEGEGLCKNCRNETKFITLGKGYNKFCSSKCIANSDEIKNKKYNTNIDKYGTEYPSQSKEVQNKTKETFIKKYGVDNPLKNKEIKNKVKKTNIEKYGYDSPFKSPDIKNKIKDTNIKKYGVNNPSKNENILKKQRETLLNNHGVSHPMYLDDVVKKVHKNRYNTFIENLNKLLDYFELELIDEKYINAHTLHNWRCKKCRKEFSIRWHDILAWYTCPVCYPRTKYKTSKGEIEICEFLDHYNISYTQGDTSTIYPMELDILIDNKNIAIEFNGIYWHSESMGKGEYYHLNKTKKCEEKGIHLIHIFEDEWIFKKEIVKNRLKQILDLNDNLPKIPARKCIITEVPSLLKNKFLDNIHLQGSDRSKIKLGAYYDNELIAVMTFTQGNVAKGSKPKENIWELNRFATTPYYNIPGVGGKLLEYFKRNYNWNKIFTYADRRWSQGKLYYNLGFNLVEETRPNYWYTYKNMRIHRFNLRKTENDDKTKTERELRKEGGYDRIWDCGNLKFEMDK